MNEINGQEKNLWFKAKWYGWGWYPASWQGWLVTLAYILLIVLFASTISENSSPREVAFTFILPVILLTLTFIRIAYKTGEKPRWQWGSKATSPVINYLMLGLLVIGMLVAVISFLSSLT